MTAFEITNEPLPPRSPRGRNGIDWPTIVAQLKANKGRWGKLGPYRSGGAAGTYARKIADDKIPGVDAALFEVHSRSHTFDDGVVGSVLWIRYVAA